MSSASSSSLYGFDNDTTYILPRGFTYQIKRVFEELNLSDLNYRQLIGSLLVKMTDSELRTTRYTKPGCDSVAEVESSIVGILAIIAGTTPKDLDVLKQIADDNEHKKHNNISKALDHIIVYMTTKVMIPENIYGKPSDADNKTGK